MLESNFEPIKKLICEPQILGDCIAQLVLVYRSEDYFFPAYCKQAIQCVEVLANIVYKPNKIQFVGISGQVKQVVYNSIVDYKEKKVMQDSIAVYPEYIIKGNPPQVDTYKEWNTGLNLDMIVVRLKQVSRRSTKPIVYEKLNLHGLIEYIFKAKKLRDAARKESILKDFRDSYLQEFGGQ